MTGLPPPIEAFNNAILRFEAVKSVHTSYLADDVLQTESFSLPGQFGDVPHALFSRTGGAQPDEVWGYTEFYLAPTYEGWLTLEFLSWWVRDQSRGGETIQMRPLALPPFVGRVQLGETLKFVIDHITIAHDSLEALLDMVGDRAENLNQTLDMYRDNLGHLLREQD